MTVGRGEKMTQKVKLEKTVACLELHLSICVRVDSNISHAGRELTYRQKKRNTTEDYIGKNACKKVIL